MASSSSSSSSSAQQPLNSTKNIVCTVNEILLSATMERARSVLSVDSTPSIQRTCAPPTNATSPHIPNKQRARVASATFVEHPSTASTSDGCLTANNDLPPFLSSDDMNAAGPKRRRRALPRSRVNLNDFFTQPRLLVEPGTSDARKKESKMMSQLSPASTTTDGDDSDNDEAMATAFLNGYTVVDHRVKAQTGYFEYLIRWNDVSKPDQWLPVSALADTKPVNEYRNPTAAQHVIGFINYAPTQVTRIGEQFVTPLQMTD